MAAPSSFLIGGAPQQNFDYMAVANQRVRVINAMTSAVGAAASLAIDIRHAKINKAVHEYSMQYRADLIEWEADNQNRYRTGEEFKAAAEEFSMAQQNKYRQAIGSNEGMQLFDEAVLPSHMNLSTKAYVAGKAIEAREWAGSIPRGIQNSKHIIFMSSDDSIADTTYTELAANKSYIDGLYANKQISKEVYEDANEDLKSLFVTAGEELMKRAPEAANEFIDLHKDQFSSTQYYTLKKGINDMLTHSASSQAKNLDKSIKAANQEALTNGRFGIYSSDKSVEAHEARLKSAFGNDPVLLNQELTTYRNNLEIGGLRKQLLSATNAEIQSVLTDAMANPEYNEGLKQGIQTMATELLLDRQNNPMKASMNHPAVAKAYDALRATEDILKSVGGNSPDMINSPDLQKPLLEAFVNFKQTSVAVQRAMGVPESQLQVFTSDEVARYQEVLNSGRARDVDVINMVNQMWYKTMDRELFEIGLSQVTKGDESGALAYAAFALQVDEVSREIIPINSQALNRVIALGTAPYPDVWKTVSSEDKVRFGEAVAEAISPLTSDIDDPNAVVGMNKFATKVFAQAYAEEQDSAKATEAVRRLMVDSMFYQVEGANGERITTAKTYVDNTGTGPTENALDPTAAKWVAEAKKLLSADDINPQLVIEQINKRPSQVKPLDWEREDDRSFAKATIEASVQKRSKWRQVGDSYILYYQDGEGGAATPVKLVNNREVRISLKDMMILQENALREVQSENAYPVNRNEKIVRDRFEDKFFNYLGLEPIDRTSGRTPTEREIQKQINEKAARIKEERRERREARQ